MVYAAQGRNATMTFSILMRSKGCSVANNTRVTENLSSLPFSMFVETRRVRKKAAGKPLSVLFEL